MKRNILAICLCLPLLTSCAHYLYQGEITEKGIDGKQHRHILSWNTTEFLFGMFDKAGDINLMTCGDPNIFTFSDDSGKIVFDGDPTKMVHAKGFKTKRGICGAILGHEIIDLIPEGKVKVGVYCDPKHEEWTMVKPMTLKARRKAYVFEVYRERSKEPAKCEPDAPEAPAEEKKEEAKK